MKFYFQKAYEKFKVGDAVSWCAQHHTVKALIKAGVLAKTAPAKPAAVPQKEK